MSNLMNIYRKSGASFVVNICFSSLMAVKEWKEVFSMCVNNKIYDRTAQVNLS